MAVAGRVDGRRTALEPIDLPPSIEQGVDMIYIDEDLVPRAIHDKALLHNIAFRDWSGAPLDMFVSMNPIYTDLRRGARSSTAQRWGDLPQVAIPDGPALKPGIDRRPRRRFPQPARLVRGRGVRRCAR